MSAVALRGRRGGRVWGDRGLLFSASVGRVFGLVGGLGAIILRGFETF